MRGMSVAQSATMTNLIRAVLIVAIIGALNWGLIGLFNWNLVDAIFGGGATEETSAFSRVIYFLVGLAGLAAIFLLPMIRRQGPGQRP